MTNITGAAYLRQMENSNSIDIKQFNIKKFIAPTIVLRSSLFSIVKKNSRMYFENKKIATIGDIVIQYSGPELDQSDFDLWLILINVMKVQDDNVITIGKKTMLTLLQKTCGQNQKDWLIKSLKRLNNATVEVKDTKRKIFYSGSLVYEFLSDDKSGMLKINLNKNTASLVKSATWLNANVRFSITGSLAKWLYGYISSHRNKGHDNDQFIGLDKLQDLSGYDYIPFRKFKYNLKKAMQELSDHKVIANWSVDENNILFFNKSERIKAHEQQELFCI